MQNSSRRIVKIAVTGGPCAGKTLGLEYIKSVFEAKGWAVLLIAETATELISGGVAPWTCSSREEYQKLQMRLQLEKERVYQTAAEGMDKENILIVCDRGAYDSKSYMTDEMFARACEYVGVTDEELKNSYQAVFFLLTAAKGAEKYYNLSNNSARTETADAAAALDDRLIAVWQGHPYLKVIDNSTDFDGKLKRLADEIETFLESGGNKAL